MVEKFILVSVQRFYQFHTFFTHFFSENKRFSNTKQTHFPINRPLPLWTTAKIPSTDSSTIGRLMITFVIFNDFKIQNKARILFKIYYSLTDVSFLFYNLNAQDIHFSWTLFLITDEEKILSVENKNTVHFLRKHFKPRKKKYFWILIPWNCGTQSDKTWFCFPSV